MYVSRIQHIYPACGKRTFQTQRIQTLYGYVHHFIPNKNIKCVIWWTKKARLSIILYKTWYKSGDSQKNFLLLQLVTKELIYK